MPWRSPGMIRQSIDPRAPIERLFAQSITESIYKKQEQSMVIKDKANGQELTIALEGRLDTVTSPELSRFLENALNDIKELVFDFEELEYISSAGLRVLLATQKTMNDKKGTMKIIGMSEIVKEIFDVTGFSDIMNIE